MRFIELKEIPYIYLFYKSDLKSIAFSKTIYIFHIKNVIQKFAFNCKTISSFLNSKRSRKNSLFMIKGCTLTTFTSQAIIFHIKLLLKRAIERTLLTKELNHIVVDIF